MVATARPTTAWHFAAAGDHESARHALGTFPGRPSSSKLAPHASVPPTIVTQLTAPTLNNEIARQPAAHQPHAIARMLRSLRIPAHTSYVSKVSVVPSLAAATASTPAAADNPTATVTTSSATVSATVSATSNTNAEPPPTFETLRAEQNHAWAAQNVARGVAHYRAGRSSEAIAAYKLAIELDPDHVDAYVARGALLGAQSVWHPCYNPQ